MSGDFVLPGFDQPEPEPAKQPPSAKDIDDRRFSKFRRGVPAGAKCQPCVDLLADGSRTWARPATFVRTLHGQPDKPLCYEHKQDAYDNDKLAGIVK